MTEAPEPEDKLDATATAVVNGLEDAPFDWHAIDWRRVEDDVRRLRQRIFTASKAVCPPTSLRGLLEPGARKRARPGSEGARHSNVSGLPVQLGSAVATRSSALGRSNLCFVVALVVSGPRRNFGSG
jgi:hypothetical protein